MIGVLLNPTSKPHANIARAIVLTVRLCLPLIILVMSDRGQFIRLARSARDRPASLIAFWMVACAMKSADSSRTSKSGSSRLISHWFIAFLLSPAEVVHTIVSPVEFHCPLALSYLLCLLSSH